MDVTQVLSRWMDALGGAERLQEVHTLHKTAVVQGFGSSGLAEEWLTDQSQYRTQMQLEVGFDSLLVINNEEGWVKRAGTTRALEGPISIIYFTVASIDWLWALLPGGLASYTNLTSSSEPSLELSLPGRLPIQVKLDPATFLPVTCVISAGDFRLDIGLSDWREVEGVKFPFHRTECEVSEGNEMVFDYQEIIANQPPPEDAFSRPSEDRLDYEFAGGASSTSFQFEMHGNKPYFSAHINRDHPIWLLLDSGCGSTSCLDLDYTQEIGIEISGSSNTGGAGEETVDAQFAKNVSFDLDGLSVRDQMVGVLPLFQTLADVEGRLIQGLYGGPLINAFVTEIDYDALTIRLHERPGYTYHGPGEVIPLQMMNNFPMVIGVVTLPGCEPAEGIFLVDTGVRNALCLSTPFVNQHHLLESSQALVHGVTGWGLGGVNREYLGRGNLTLGSFQFDDLVVTLSQDTRGALASDMINGIIGGDLLKRFRTIFDYPEKRLILEPGQLFGQPFAHDASGLFLRSQAPAFDRAIVVGVFDKSPAAEAGLQEGDEILTINGQPFAALGLEQMRRLLLKESQVVQFGLHRNGQELSADFTTRCII